MMFTAVPMTNETWLICGGRDFADQGDFDSVMGAITARRGCPSRVVHGGARGADALAGAWGERMAIEVLCVPADWRTHGRAAGPIRNQKMLDDHHPDFVIAFPGGRGTADMVRRVKGASIGLAEVTRTNGNEPRTPVV